MKLYIYDHCPYCVKARMIFGLKNVSLELITLLNDDESGPVSMIGVKMVPILEIKKGDFMPESLDIISYIDERESTPMVSSWEEDKKLMTWIRKNNDVCYQLAMPRWVKVPLDEFKTQGAKDYFQQKKEAYIGSFESCLKNTNSLIESMKQELNVLESFFTKEQDFFKPSLSVNDFHLFAFLRSLSIVKGLHFPEKVKRYSEKLSEQTRIPLHHSIAL